MLENENPELLSCIADLENREELRQIGNEPWSTPGAEWTARCRPGGNNRVHNAVAKKAFKDLFASGNFYIVIYTDGAAVEGWRNGGSAAFITSGEVENPTELHVIKTIERKLTSSLEE